MFSFSVSDDKGGSSGRECYAWVSLITFLNKQWTAGQCEVSIRKDLSCKCPDSFPDTCGMIYVHEWTSIFLHKRITCIKHTHTHLVQNHIRAHQMSTSCTIWLVIPKNTCFPGGICSRALYTSWLCDLFYKKNCTPIFVLLRNAFIFKKKIGQIPAGLPFAWLKTLGR